MIAEEFETRFDTTPGFWQFLNELSSDDLVVEMVQNELDAESSHTRIAFEAERFICEGNGKPIDEDGWKRLSFMTGAGGEAPPKHRRIGVKNHGLKNCFTLGDEIVLRSGGQRRTQTLYCNGHDKPPKPGASKFLSPDMAVAASGCRIEVPYRRKVLTPQEGERLHLSPPDAGMIEAIFRKACAEAPERFIGALRPGMREKYTIELHHHMLGTWIFQFRCGVPQRIKGGQIFSRTCAAHDGEGRKMALLREGAFLFSPSLPMDLAGGIPEFYGTKRAFFTEVAWRANAKGAPIPAVGQLRYPIAYPSGLASARTGLGVHYSAPFISDRERHGTSRQGEDWKVLLTRACDEALIGVLRAHLIPQHGPQALCLLLASDEAQRERLGELTSALLARGAMPLRSISRRKVSFGPVKDSAGIVRPVVAPVYLWESGKIVSQLVELCPPEYPQIHPDVPEQIVALLANRDFAGFSKTQVTFDEDDVLDRMNPRKTDTFFNWPSEEVARTAIANLEFVRRSLDVLHVCAEKKKWADAKIAQMKRDIHLPDSHGGVRPLAELFLSSDLPTTIAPLEMPALLHPKLCDHPFFKRTKWKPDRYTLETFIEKVDFSSQTEEARRTFWRWLLRYWRDVPTKAWAKLTIAALWPDSDGGLRVLGDFCQPTPAVARVLSSILVSPDSELSRLSILRKKGRRFPRLRSHPSSDELGAYYGECLRQWPPGQVLGELEIESFRSFEAELLILARDKDIASWLRGQQGFALSRSRVLRLTTELHRPEAPDIAPLALHPDDLLDRPELALDRIFPPRCQPSAQAIIHALTEDGANAAALIPRLQAVAKVKRLQSDFSIAEIPCIPHEGGVFAPARLAFKGSHGDYWGKWKMPLSGKGLSGSVQELYRAVGVGSAEPKPETSREFFRWLNDQPNTILANHLATILRHINHREGVLSWWESDPGRGCIPVEVGAEVRLVCRTIALRENSPVFLPDFPALEQAIRDSGGNERAMLAVVSHAAVGESATERLRQAGVQSLRLAAGSPTSVRGDGERVALPNIMSRLAELLSPDFARNLRKRLADLDVPTAMLRSQWQNRLGAIRRVQAAPRIAATYKLGKRSYEVEVTSTFEEASGVLWVRQSERENLVKAFFEVIASRMFADDAPKYVAYLLEGVIHHEVRESPVTRSHPTAAGDPDAGESDSDFDNPVPGETFQTHRQSAPDCSKDLPNPAPLSSISNSPLPNNGRDRASRAPSTPRSMPGIEIAHVQELKRDHYAWHCQMCLARKPPSVLAAAGSYAELQEHRHKFMVAHHPDQVHAAGARHGGNLLILCDDHHDRLGDVLTRDEIADALRTHIKPKAIAFHAADHAAGKKRVVAGFIATVRGKVLSRDVRLFFTAEHRDLWLQAAE